MGLSLKGVTGVRAKEVQMAVAEHRGHVHGPSDTSGTAVDHGFAETVLEHEVIDVVIAARIPDIDLTVFQPLKDLRVTARADEINNIRVGDGEMLTDFSRIPDHPEFRPDAMFQ